MTEFLLVLALTFGGVFVFFILPQRRREQAHQAMVASLQVGDEVILGAGVYGRIVDLGPEDMELEVAPGVVLRVARMAVLRRIENALPDDQPGEVVDEPENDD